MGAGYADLTPVAKDVTASSSKILDTNGEAKYRCFQNTDGSAKMYIKPVGAVTVKGGIEIQPLQSYEMSREAGNLDTRAIYAIHDGSGTKTMLVTEGV